MPGSASDSAVPMRPDFYLRRARGQIFKDSAPIIRDRFFQTAQLSLSKQRPDIPKCSGPSNFYRDSYSHNMARFFRNVTIYSLSAEAGSGLFKGRLLGFVHWHAGNR